MTPFEITILGSNSAVPTPTRHPTSQLLNINHHYYLIDCGEGAQIQMRKFGIKFQRIEHIFDQLTLHYGDVTDSANIDSILCKLKDKNPEIHKGAAYTAFGSYAMAVLVFKF